MLREGRFVKVPLLVGANTDEGTSFGPKGIDNDTAFAKYVSSTGPNANETTILETLYPDIPSIGIPETLHGRPNSTYGSQYKRSSAFAGDLYIHAPRRAHSQAWSQQDISSYSFRFNVLVAGLSQYSGSNHFQEFAFVADNTQGLGYGDPNPAYPNPFAGKPLSYFDLANLMSRMWVSFVHDLNPNNHNVPGVPQWPIYDTTNGYAREYVFDANVTSYVEIDNYRAEAIQYMIDESAALFDR
ncbi:hypothetical protein LTR70_009043 [Exophiala xenobiotica]|uniref:Carboxylesterase type B domain-containing protein n=1 Tax=Lithohypha guttulata TaxID=1690604 RepID=A0ABR0JZG8_9EURO|nr:hypothetical protein LTR24_008740 [Lithohypha guttulata]KAK5311093.1 hypothetical protein LTR70_009043 [Exophiala xenobiotica]